MTDTDALLLRYSHNIVEHLGLKLYQNQPTRVIAEVISNSWDADSTEVAVNLHMDSVMDRWVSVADNGDGMSRSQLSDSYLVIGQPKRGRPDSTSATGRKFMGRKGIGKLAPFGIARYVDLVTSQHDGGASQVYWLRFDLDAVLNKGSANELVTYAPHVLCDGVPLTAVPTTSDTTGEVAKWCEMISTKGTGTLVLMRGLTISRAISVEQLMHSIGTRFTVAIGNKMRITVNGDEVTLAKSLPAFEFRIPSEGVEVVEVDGREVRAWAGFVRSADWPADAAGVGVYAHNKIAQDRPFTFGLKGKEVFARYMLGFVEADWLDELNSDVISTDRTSVNWADPSLAALHEWGENKTREWLVAFELWRREQSVEENRALVREAITVGSAPRVTDAEEEEIVRLVSEITPSFGKDASSKRRLVEAVSDAWVQKPMRQLVKDLWSSFGRTSVAPTTFIDVIERLKSHSVPESLNLAVIFAQRAFALTKLHEYIHHGREVDLQRLIERFPWIVEPDLAVLTANESLKRAVERAESEGALPTGRRAPSGVPDQNRPDFVFLSSPEARQIVVVELKNPQDDLTIENEGQALDYMRWFDSVYPASVVTGYLIGRNTGDKLPSRKTEGFSVIPWSEVLQRSRARNLELLSAMLLGTGAYAVTDARAIDAVELGGDEAKKMLERLAGSHRELKELMDSFEK